MSEFRHYLLLSALYCAFTILCHTDQQFQNSFHYNSKKFPKSLYKKNKIKISCTLMFTRLANINHNALRLSNFSCFFSNLLLTNHPSFHHQNIVDSWLVFIKCSYLIKFLLKEIDDIIFTIKNGKGLVSMEFKLLLKSRRLNSPTLYVCWLGGNLEIF